MSKDETTLKLIQEVNKRKAEISKLEKPDWKTNASFSFDGKVPINIKVVSDVRELVNMAAFLTEREEYYKKAVKTLELTESPPFEWCNFSLAEWVSDLKTRINIIQLSSKRKKLEQLESRLNAIISPELRAEMELRAIELELS